MMVHKKIRCLADFKELSENSQFPIFTPWILETGQPWGKKMWKILECEQKERKAVRSKKFLCLFHRKKTENTALMTWAPDPKD